jgi:hypothetical protein
MPRLEANGSVLIWILAVILGASVVHNQRIPLPAPNFSQYFAKSHLPQGRPKYVAISDIAEDPNISFPIKDGLYGVVWGGYDESDARFAILLSQLKKLTRADNDFTVAGVVVTVGRIVRQLITREHSYAVGLQERRGISVVLHNHSYVWPLKDSGIIRYTHSQHSKLMEHQGWDRDPQSGLCGQVSGIRALLCSSDRTSEAQGLIDHLVSLFPHDASLSLHPLGLRVNLIAGFSQQYSLPYHRDDLQEANNYQSECEPYELPLYGYILAALLASLIASWGGWLWGGGHRVRGGLLAVLGLWLITSTLTAVGFADPLFWRVGWRIMAGQNPDRRDCQKTEERHSFQHNEKNVSQKSLTYTVYL